MPCWSRWSSVPSFRIAADPLLVVDSSGGTRSSAPPPDRPDRHPTLLGGPAVRAERQLVLAHPRCVQTIARGIDRLLFPSQSVAPYHGRSKILRVQRIPTRQAKHSKRGHN